MLFNSFEFIAFFVIVLLVHYLSRSWSMNKIFLLLASYYFYASWNAPFVLLLWISTLVDWYVGKGLARTERTNLRRLLLGMSLATNLGLLGYFKYAGFIMETFAGVLAFLHIPAEQPTFSIILPVGISFYTFQTLSYTLDIHRRKAQPWHSFLDFALYVTFFPQLVAGPIVRATEFLPQCTAPRRATGEQFGYGLLLMLIGFFQKITIADGLLAPVVEQVYDSPVAPNFASAWAGTLAFSGQIFCDFAGYSSCAIGAALCLGFILPMNFHSPYASLGFSDFWRRWHISLSTWLRDYLYIPLGGNRRGVPQTAVNLTITMLLGGLWHGASWTFIVWGGLHGLYLAAERALGKLLPGSGLPRLRLGRLLLTLLTFVLVCIAWVFFRASTFEKAFAVLAPMLGFAAAGSVKIVPWLDVGMVGAITLGLVGAHWLMRDTTLEKVVEAWPWWFRSLAIAFMIMAITTISGEDRAFIYFQF